MKKFVVFALVFSVQSLAFSMEHLDGIAATVGDEIILYSELEAYSLMRLNSSGVKPDSADYDRLKSDFLQELIDGKVMLVHAKKDSTINVSAQEVEAAVDAHLAQLKDQSGLNDEQFEKELMAQGLTPARFKSQMRRMFREQLLKQRIQQAQMGRYNPTRKDVEEFYRTYHDSLPTLGESFRLLKLVLKIAPTDSIRLAAYTQITSIKTRLDNGEDFAKLAKQFSQDPNAQDGGRLGFIAKGTLNELVFEETAFGLKPGEISEPFETRLGWHIVKVTARRDQMVDVSQIFIPVAASDVEVQKLTTRLDSIAAAVSSPEQFKEAVRIFSQDPSSKSKGGDIGWFTKLGLPSRYSAAFEKLTAGAVSKPVKEENALVLLMIERVVEQRNLTLKDDWEMLEEKTRDIYAQKRLREQVDKWRKQVLIDTRL